jgi:hypothetical protein
MLSLYRADPEKEELFIYNTGALPERLIKP